MVDADTKEEEEALRQTWERLNRERLAVESRLRDIDPYGKPKPRGGGAEHHDLPPPGSSSDVKDGPYTSSRPPMVAPPRGGRGVPPRPLEEDTDAPEYYTEVRRYFPARPGAYRPGNDALSSHQRPRPGAPSSLAPNDAANRALEYSRPNGGRDIGRERRDAADAPPRASTTTTKDPGVVAEREPALGMPPPSHHTARPRRRPPTRQSETDQARSKRMFGALVGHLGRAKTKLADDEAKIKRRRKAEAAAEERLREARVKAMDKETREWRRAKGREIDERDSILTSIRATEARLLFASWRARVAATRKHFLVTTTTSDPPLCWRPRVFTEKTEALLSTRQDELDAMITAKKDALDAELKDLESARAERSARRRDAEQRSREADQQQLEGTPVGNGNDADGLSNEDRGNGNDEDDARAGDDADDVENGHGDDDEARDLAERRRRRGAPGNDDDDARRGPRRLRLDDDDDDDDDDGAMHDDDDGDDDGDDDVRRRRLSAAAADDDDDDDDDDDERGVA